MAIMAGKCSLEGSFESIQNAFDIFDRYFSPIISTLNKNEILVATLIALFDTLTLNTEAKPIELAAQQGIEYKEFTDICEVLHIKEVVSIFKDQAVKFEDQNLRDYLLYYIFFKTKRLTPSYLILNAFPKYSSKIVYAFNTLIKLFYTEENLTYIETEVRKVWSEIKTQPDKTVFEFVKLFHNVIPDEALITLKREIEHLPNKHINFCTFDFDKNNSHRVIHSEIIDVLSRFKYSDRFVEAIQLVFNYLEKNTEYPMDFYFLFSELWSFGIKSDMYQYAQECLLIEQLFNFYETNKTPEAALCLNFCAFNYLKFKFFSAENLKGNSMTFYNFGLSACDEVYTIRSFCFKALAALFSNEKYKSLAINSLLKYTDIMKAESSNRSILEHDIKVFSTIFEELLDANIFEHCRILGHFYDICEQNDIIPSNMLQATKKNKIFTLYQTLKKDNFHKYRSWDRVEQARKNKIYTICQRTTDAEFECLWDTLENCNLKQDNEWYLATGINFIFDALAGTPKRFIAVLSSYIKHNVPFSYLSEKLVMKLIEVLGYDDALNLIQTFEFGKKEWWLTEIYNNIPLNRINENTPGLLIEELFRQRGNDRLYTLTVQTVNKINALYPGFLISYTAVLNEVCQNYAFALSNFLNPIGQYDNAKLEEFVASFSNHIDILKNAYIIAMDGNSFYDYEEKLMLQIINRDILFIPMIVKNVLKANHSNCEIILDIFWDQDNYDELIILTMDSIRKELQTYYSYNRLAEHLLAHVQGKSDRWERQDNWVNNYIRNNNTDSDLMKFLFGIICNLSYDLRKSSVLLFCKFNRSFTDFKSIYLLPSNLSWSGSEVPLLEQRISFLEDLKNELIGFDYIEHREYLASYIQSIREYKENVLLEEFFEEI